MILLLMLHWPKGIEGVADSLEQLWISYNRVSNENSRMTAMTIHEKIDSLCTKEKQIKRAREVGL